MEEILLLPLIEKTKKSPKKVGGFIVSGKILDENKEEKEIYHVL